MVLLHGFPEQPSCWRAQIAALAAGGYRVIAPYLRGYHPSPAPIAPSDYVTGLLVADVVALLDRFGVRRAVLVGHDWGAQLAWWVGQLRPDRVAALAALSVPFTPRPRTPPLTRLRELAGGSFFYMDYFQRQGVAEAELGADPRRLLTALYYTASGACPAGAFRRLPREGTRLADQLIDPAEMPAWLPAEDLDATVAAFTVTGFTGALNYYRAMDVSWQLHPELEHARVRCPAVFLAGERDLVLTFTPTRHMTSQVPLVRPPVLLPGAGHWVQREAAEAVTETLLGFLAQLPTEP